MSAATTIPADRVPTAPGALPVVGHVPALLRSPLPLFASLSEHGDVVRLRLGSRPIYYLTNAELIHTMLVKQAEQLDKGKIFERSQAFLGNGLATTDNEFHIGQRRLIQPAFVPGRLPGYVTLIREQAEAAISGWRPGKPLQFARVMNELALNVISVLVFSRHLSQADFAAVRGATPHILKGMILRTVYPSSRFERLPIPANRRFDTAVETLHELTGRVIEEGRSGGDLGDNVMSLLLSAEDPRTGKPMDPRQIRDEVMTMLIGGSETTALQMAWLFHELSLNPAIAERVYAENREVLGGRPCEYEDVGRMPYLRQVVLETVRRHTLTWLVMRRTRAEFTLGDIRFPEGTELVFSPTTIHRDPRLYPDPMRFDPDRWLPEAMRERPRSSFIPFGAGRRKCIGDALALLEVTVVAATIMTRWRLAAASTGEVGENVLSAAVAPTNLVLRPEPLDSAATAGGGRS
ncbi:cytochrome P450 [Amycolatopsis thailandensis]|nr:cytochrome P450 [Amycolatopsis thailandensis]